jgi:alkylhydroperoxidase family enzyme
MARLPYPSRAAMPEGVTRLLDQFPRQAITEMFAHAETLTEPFLRMAQAQFTGLELTDRQRELVILTVAGLVECEYEYAQHKPIAEAAGIAPYLQDALYSGDPDAVSDPVERALVGFVAGIITAPHVSDEVFAAASRELSPRRIVEVLQVVTFYWGIGRICTVLRLEIDHPSGLEPITAVSMLEQHS